VAPGCRGKKAVNDWHRIGDVEPAPVIGYPSVNAHDSID